MCKLLTTDIPTVHFLETVYLIFLLLINDTQNPYKKFYGGTVMASDMLDYATREHDIPFITHFTSQSVVFSEWNRIFNGKSWVDSSGIDFTAIEEICWKIRGIPWWQPKAIDTAVLIGCFLWFLYSSIRVSKVYENDYGTASTFPKKKKKTHYHGTI